MGFLVYRRALKIVSPFLKNRMGFLVLKKKGGLK
jgi:hypothetical protein